MAKVTDDIRAACETHVGRRRNAVDAMDPERARAMQGLFDEAPSLALGDALPPLWHWLYFHDTPRISELGRDGHEALGRFLPPAPFDRRMWAGGALEFHAPLVLGIPAEKESEVASVAFKTGSSGELCFVDVAHRISQGGALKISETQTVVYRDKGVAVEMPSWQGDRAGWEQPDIRLLYRYSALTYNGHRIHYDRDFCRDEEGYPGLVVHGPLLATHLARGASEQGQGAALRRFDFRALAPVFEGVPFRVKPAGARPETVEIERADGITAMRAELGWTAP